ncbi:MAG: hypothetical protein HY719_00935 [Planctomycetes bacterium]|nr:hypothetical protein [Planctomycetota bacterium]
MGKVELDVGVVLENKENGWKLAIKQVTATRILAKTILPDGKTEDKNFARRLIEEKMAAGTIVVSDEKIAVRKRVKKAAPRTPLRISDEGVEGADLAAAPDDEAREAGAEEAPAADGDEEEEEEEEDAD